MQSLLPLGIEPQRRIRIRAALDLWGRNLVRPQTRHETGVGLLSRAAWIPSHASRANNTTDDQENKDEHEHRLDQG
jgi:hypothetical protein